MSWVEMVQDTAILKYSTFDGSDWDQTSTVASSTDWFVNWADFPSVIAKSGQPMAAHWLSKKLGGTYAYDVTISTFSDGIQNDPLVIHDDETPTEHGFVSMQPVTDSTFYVIWLDGRNTSGGHDSHDKQNSKLASAMTLRGALINVNGNKIEESEIDNSVCDCCSTSLTSTDNGLLAVYRNRTSNETRDIHIASYHEGRWTQLGSVADDNWEIAACPVNGPKIDSDDRNVAVAWFTGAQDKPLVKLAISNDSGSIFSEPIVLDSENPLGRVDVEFTNNGELWVSWMTRKEAGSAIVVKKMDLTGTVISEHQIDGINPSRSTGFPQISKTKNGDLLLAWTEVNDDSRSVQTVILQ